MVDFTKKAAEEAMAALDEMYRGLPKTKQGEYLGHLNEISLFIEAAKREAMLKHKAEAK